MFCLSCGKKISSRSVFCKYCGINQKKIKTVNKDKIKKYVWTCFYCDGEFETKLEADKHEIICINNPKNHKFYFNNNPKKAWFILWITTMLVFGITLFISLKYVESQILLLSGGILLGTFLFNILMGVFAFFAMAISDTRPRHKTTLFIKNILLICLLYLIINPVIFATEGYKSLHNPEYAKKYSNNLTPSVVPTSPFSQNYVSPTNTPTPAKKITTKTNTNTTSGTSSGTVECIGPDGKHFNTSMNECKALNEKWGKPVDYMVNCKMSSNCGGESKWIKKSECDNAVCCQIGSSWIFYSSKSKCDSDQANSNGSNSGNTSNSTTVNDSPKVQFQATETSIKGTYYCYENKVNSLVTQQSFVKQYREIYETCKDSSYNKGKYSDCCNTNNCYSLSGSEKDTCYTNCYNGAYGTCNDYYSSYSKERSKLDSMRWDYCP